MWHRHAAGMSARMSMSIWMSAGMSIHMSVHLPMHRPMHMCMRVHSHVYPMWHRLQAVVGRPTPIYVKALDSFGNFLHRFHRTSHRTSHRVFHRMFHRHVSQRWCRSRGRGLHACCRRCRAVVCARHRPRRWLVCDLVPPIDTTAKNVFGRMWLSCCVGLCWGLQLLGMPMGGSR